MFIFDNQDMIEDRKPRYLINFPTKDHWRSNSKLEFIHDGLDDLVEQLKKLDIKSVAIPPLGCGNGGLDWAEVKPLIEEKLNPVEGIEFYVFEPKEQQIVSEFSEIALVDLKMTEERAILFKTFAVMTKYFGGSLTPISAQKITYFLQVLGVNFNLKFAKEKYGPHSETLSDAFKRMEEANYIAGYTEKKEIEITDKACIAANDFLQDNANAEDIIHRLSLLIDGFESPYGMELLATVHYLAKDEAEPDIQNVISSVHDWSPRKEKIFLPENIENAFRRLQTDGLIN